MSSGRAVYIPPAKRRQHQTASNTTGTAAASNSSSRSNHTSKRFHGAFTGGFSAGYFNTVATKEGWTPSTQKRKDQQISDFMDEQDHEEWGGPTALRTEYQQDDPTTASNSSNNKKLPEAFAPLTPFFKVSHISVGPRLLRRLGYREADGSAYVQQEDTQQGVAPGSKGENDDGDQSVSHVLSKKRLRKIQLQSSRMVLPPPKLDTCGLGFVALLDAPEFQQYKERRKQQAKLRARGATDVYRLDHLISQPGQSVRSTVIAKEDLDHEAYEAPEDFVGSRSAAGFALRDEDDDAYDTSLTGRLFSGRGAVKPTKAMLGEEYQDFIDDPADDSSDDGDQQQLPQQPPKPSQGDKVSKPSSKKDLFGGALAQWATGVAATGSSKTASSAAKAPVPGFSWGGSMELHKKRYPGPDIPRDYEVTKHVFAAPPSIPQRLQTVQASSRHEYGCGPQPPNPPASTSMIQRDMRRLGGETFVSLAAAMKNRFTSASTPDNSNSESSDAHQGSGPKQSVGLRWPSQIQPAKAQGDQTNHATDPTLVSPQPQVSVSRTTKSFSPHPLLCKRFGVPAPSQASVSESNTKLLAGKEAQFFENEVLPTLRKQPQMTKNTPKEVVSSEREPTESMVESKNGEEGDVDRPPLEELRTIFQSASDNSEDDTDLDSVSNKDEQDSLRQEPIQTIPDNSEQTATQDIDVPFAELAGIAEAPAHNDATNQATSQAMTVYEEPPIDIEREKVGHHNENSSDESSRRVRKRRRKHRHKSRKEHKRSRSRHKSKHDDGADSDSDESRYRRRKERTKKERKRKKKHRSSDRHDNSSGNGSD